MYLKDCRLYVMLLALTMSFYPLKAQEPVSEILLIDLVQEIQAAAKIDLSFDPSLVEGFYVKKVNTQSPVADLQLFFEKETPFRLEQVKDTYYILKPGIASLSITIVDTVSQQAIPGVYIKKNGQYAQSVTDQDGKISLEFEWNKEDTLLFEFLGYATQEMSVITLLKMEDPVISLQEGSTVLNELIIHSYLGDGITANQKNHSLQIKNGELGIFPGDTDKDLLVSLKNLPGIQTVSGRAGELRVRGSTPDQTLLLYNDIPIFHRGYNFSTLSPFSTDIIDDVRIYRSGYSSDLPGRVGGIVLLESTTKVPDSLQLGLSTNSFLASTYVKAPIIANRLGITFSFRGNHPFDWVSPREQAYQDLALGASFISVRDEQLNFDVPPFDFNFWDLNGSVIYQSPKAGDFKFNYLSINNSADITQIDVNNANTEIRGVLLDNDGISLKWEKNWRNTSANISISNSNYQYVLDNTSLPDNDESQIRQRTTTNAIDNSRLHAGLVRKLNSEVSELKLGYELSSTMISFGNGNMNGNGMGPGAPPADSTVNHAVYTSILIPDFKKFLLDVGLRSTYYGRTDILRVEPRAFLNYHLNNHLTFKSSFGLYSQDIVQSTFFDLSDIANEKLSWFFAGNREEVITSWQALLGAAYQHKNWLLDLDIYRKSVENMSTVGNFLDEGNGRIFTRRLFGGLRSVGMDMLFKYRLKNIDLWTTYTLSRTELIFPELKTDPFPANYDQTHILNVSAAYHKNNWRASLGWSFASGLPNYLENRFFPGTGGGRSGQTIQPPTPLANIDRFGNTHQLDASVTYSIAPKDGKYRLTFGLSVLNLYDRENLLETAIVNIPPIGPQTFSPRQEDRFNIRFAPDFMIKIEW